MIEEEKKYLLDAIFYILEERAYGDYIPKKLSNKEIEALREIRKHMPLPIELEKRFFSNG